MNYGKTTNRELNIKLASLLGLIVCEKKTNELDCMMNQLQRDFLDVDSDGSIFANGKFIDFCTDWSATMPIAVERGVELSPCYNGWWFAGAVESYTNEEEVLSYSGITVCEDPLRAIVICLIKALEAKNDNRSTN